MVRRTSKEGFCSTIVDDRQLIALQEEEITIEKTVLGRATAKQLQGFASISIAQLLPQSEVDKLPDEHKKTLLQKLCPADDNGLE